MFLTVYTCSANLFDSYEQDPQGQLTPHPSMGNNNSKLGFSRFGCSHFRMFLHVAIVFVNRSSYNSRSLGNWNSSIVGSKRDSHPSPVKGQSPQKEHQAKKWRQDKNH